jgi:2-iminoacetate synthase
MSFYQALEKYREFNFDGYVSSITPRKIESLLAKDALAELDFLALLSDAAAPYLEPMAQKADRITRRHFGNAITLFTPLYISNYCDNVCAYCSFARQHRIARRHLSTLEIRDEARLIAGSGIRHLLVLTGESRSRASVEYLAESLRGIRESFSSIGIEVYPLTEEEYGRCIDEGADGLTIFQETYDEAAYHRYHRGGPKDDYRFRLEAPDRACGRGMRTISVGALLGLERPIRESFFTGLHARYLQNAYPQAEVSISLPRIRPLAGRFTPPYIVGDERFVQTIVATRLFLHTVGITISTRESRRLRDALLPLGVTKMSAGVSTAVGGHSDRPSTTQFEIADDRSVETMKSDLLSLGYQPVMQDWNSRFL